MKPGKRRLGALVVVDACRVQAVATPPGCMVVDALSNVVVAQKPAKREPRPIEPGAVARHAIGRTTGGNRSIRFDRLLIESRSSAALFVKPLVADGREAPVDGLQIHQPGERAQPVLDHTRVFELGSRLEQRKGQLCVRVGERALWPRPARIARLFESVQKEIGEKRAWTLHRGVAAEASEVRG